MALGLGIHLGAYEIVAAVGAERPTGHFMIRGFVSSLCIAGCSVAPASAGQRAPVPSAVAPGSAIILPASYDGPPAPLSPDVINRSADGTKATIRAVRLTSPLKVDGRLDEEVYQTVPSISDFIQQAPHEGEPATEKTEVWLFYDDDSFYVVARCGYRRRLCPRPANGR
jgi:hypothetical protein